MSGPARTVVGLDSPGRRFTGVGIPLHRMSFDLGALLVLLALIAVAFLPVFDTVWLFVTVLGAGVLGAGLAFASAVWRWSAGRLGVAVLALWFVLGTPLVMPSAGIATVIPTARSLLGLATGPVTAWRDMLSLEPPIGETTNLLAVPALVALSAALLAALIRLRSSRPMLAWMPLVAGWMVAVTLGAAVAVVPVVQGVVLATVVVVWTSRRRLQNSSLVLRRSPGARWVRGSLGVLTLLIAAAVAVSIAPLLAPATPRTTARQAVTPPVNEQEFSSPLQAFRANLSREQDATLLQVRGVPEGQIIRVATLDRFDGISFKVATTDDEAIKDSTFSRVGEQIRDDTSGDAGEVEVTVGAYVGVWVPTVGRTTGINFTGDRDVALTESFYYNRDSGTGIALARLEEGDAYSLSTLTTERPSDAAIAGAAAGRHVMPRDTGVPEEVRNLAHEWGDAAGPAGAKALQLEAQLRSGYFSHGQSGEVLSKPGHSAARMLTLLSNPSEMVGDGEQYASVMALMARELGIPARVIYGYRANGTSTVTGSDVGAWTELSLGELGWVVFDPTPDEGRVLEDPPAPMPPTPQPQIENPPPPAEDPQNPPPEGELPIDPGEPPEQPGSIDWAVIGAWLVFGAFPLLTVVVPLVLVVGFKLRRRMGRRNDPDTANRVAGAWSEVVDRARDLGRSPSPAATRSEQAERLVEDFPRLLPQTDLQAMSRQADRLVFAPEDPTHEVASSFWDASRTVEHGLRGSVGWPRWVLSRLSTRSFRRLR